MARLALLVLLLAPIAFPQAPPDDPAKLIATIDGRPVTTGELFGFLSSLPPALQQLQAKDLKEFIRMYGFYSKLKSMAEEQKLDQQSPHKERLDAVRLQILAQAQLDELSRNTSVPPEDVEKVYKEDPARFTRVRASQIVISYGAKARSEADAKKLADELAGKAKSGANFAELAKKHSDDKESSAKGGDIGFVKQTDNIPAVLKEPMFSMKPSQVSDSIKLPNGYYLIRVDAREIPPFHVVKSEIHQQLQSQAVSAIMAKLRDSVDVKLASDVPVK